MKGFFLEIELCQGRSVTEYLKAEVIPEFSLEGA